MSYFIHNDVLLLNQPFILKGEEALHLIKSRRVLANELVEIQDSHLERYQTRVISTSRRDLELLPIKKLYPPEESPFSINLYQALVKEKAMDLIIQKSTELGVSSITFFQSLYSQKIKKEIEKQLVRWKRIALEACKQSGRKSPPQIQFTPALKINSQSEETSTVPTLRLQQSKTASSFEQVQNLTSEVNLLIGPEGGWQAEEELPENCRDIYLGPRILRSETAAISAVSVLQYLYGDLTLKTSVRSSGDDNAL